MEKTKVAIIGLGTVGSGRRASCSLDHGDRTARHAGRTLWLEKAVVRDLKKSAQLRPADGRAHRQRRRGDQRSRDQGRRQLIGGLEPARTIMLRLLESGKDVVTANKALLAEHGPELFDRARELGRSIAFEASVAGGIPIIANISQCLSANQIESLDGILNGTTQFHPHARCTSEGDAVRRRARRGPAAGLRRGRSDAGRRRQRRRPEAGDPRPPGVRRPRRIGRTFPAMGIDTARRERRALRPGDGLPHQAAGRRRAGRRHAGAARLADAGEARPAAGRRERAVQRDPRRGRRRGAADVLHGQGAGQMPTASAVVADMIDTAVGRTAITFRTLELWSNRKARVTPRDHAKADGRFYLRVNVEDHPGVLAQIADVLGEHNISISSVLQHEAAERRRHRAARDHDARDDRRGDARRRARRSTSCRACAARRCGCGCGIRRRCCYASAASRI